MRVFIVLLLVLLSFPALAEVWKTTDKQQCFYVHNQSGYRIYGSIDTDYFTDDTGFKRHHRANFALENKFMQQFCTKGPYFPGGKVGMTLRTAIPVFSCKTKPMGRIVVKSTKDDAGATKFYASCVL